MKISLKYLALSLCLTAVVAAPAIASSYFGKNTAPKTEDVAPEKDEKVDAEKGSGVVVEEVTVTEVPANSVVEEAAMEAPTTAENLDPTEGQSAS